jgi:hypothetical protein
LNPPVDPNLLAHVEDAAGCLLPEGYRDFLLAHDGGAGPCWGILPLSESLAYLRGDLSSLGRDFPLTDEVDFMKECGAPLQWEEHVQRLQTDPPYDAAFDELKRRYLGFEALPGRMPFCENGCGEYFFIAVRGPKRGTVWLDSVDTSSGVFYRAADFWEFCEAWFARMLSPGPHR